MINTNSNFKVALLFSGLLITGAVGAEQSVSVSESSPECTAMAIMASSVQTDGGGISSNVSASSDGAAATVDNNLGTIQSTWARIYYSELPRDKKLIALDQLADCIAALKILTPDSVDLLIWHGIVLSTRAGVDGGMSALKTVKRARAEFQRALEIDEYALEGSAHLSIGSLYYQVPSWPIGFGSMKKARYHLTRAQQINPAGIDVNFFYAGYLEKSGELADALRALRKALRAPARPGREAADVGRRGEIRDAIRRIEQKTLSG